MGILSRMLRLCKADVHGVMDQLEDKGLLLKQALREMEASLKAKEGRLEEIGRHCRQIERDLSVRREEAQKLEKDLDLAVSKEKDDIARMLIRKRRVLQSSCDQLTRQMAGLEEERSALSETVSRQRLQYEQMKIKAGTFCREAETRRYEEVNASIESGYDWKAPNEEEVELELLQRKEALDKGGAP
ncbi:MAG: PspA/IM30 family protein [Desulfobacteraceae bacterium]